MKKRRNSAVRASDKLLQLVSKPTNDKTDHVTQNEKDVLIASILSSLAFGQNLLLFELCVCAGLLLHLIFKGS